ncbi:IclR family transcriptional regulator [Jannaschia sp. R86511]|uniref:IclR family transcriptional regulator n=1 Tax=Jannaschia sp. R86511 TaxID=3093853 RepID=UPI0036D21459
MPQPPTVRRNTSGLARDVAVLDLLADAERTGEGGLGVLRVAAALGRDKAAVSRALATLADAGLVSRDPHRLTYSLGPRLYALAALTAESSLARQARPVLRQMVHQLRETTHLCVLRGGNVLTLVSEVSPQQVGTLAWAGSTTAAWLTPSGRVLISDWDRASVDSWYAAHGQDAGLVDHPTPPALGAFSVPAAPDPARVVVRDLLSLHAELARVRRRGWAVSDEELETGVVAASSPVRDATGSVVAALNVSAPRTRLGERLDELGSYLARCAATLSTQLGAPAPGG